jgi:hypothetical protein
VTVHPGHGAHTEEEQHRYPWVAVPWVGYGPPL